MEILHEINPALEALAYLGSRAIGHTLDRLEERVNEQEKMVTAICGLQKDMEHTKSDVSVTFPASSNSGNFTYTLGSATCR